MDNCYQRRDATSASQGTACNTVQDDGIFRAYGLVYFLLAHGVTVYWAIDGATPKLAPTDVDVTVAAPASGPVVAKYDWTSTTPGTAVVPYDCGSGTCPFPAGTAIHYVGGPFVIDAREAATVFGLLQSHPDFASFRREQVVDLHVVQNGFTVPQARPLTGPPPKVAILDIAAPAGKKTSSNVMYQYAVAAGLSWPCVGNGDCAGGLGPGCSLPSVLAYLANPAGDTPIPQECSPAGCTAGSASCACAPNFNQGPGLLYDVLCDGDFIPPTAADSYASTQLARGSYKLLWVPHWDTDGVTPTGATGSGQPALPAVTAEDKLAWELADIAAFVNAGNNLFVECLGIQAMEGVLGETDVNGMPYGIPATRFQTTSGIFDWNGPSSAQSILVPTEPDVQVGDFQFSLVTGAITTYAPSNSTTPPASAFKTGATVLIDSAAPAASPAWNVSSVIQVTGAGTVAYLGGHDYSPTADLASSGYPVSTPTAHQTPGQTAGTRIVLNTLFNLGFGCAAVSQ